MTFILAEIQPVVAVIPLFVWIAVALAALLAGAGVFLGEALKPFFEAVNGPVGYATLVVLIGLIAWATYRKRRSGDESGLK